MQLYHVLNRGVEKRIIFLDDRDRARFVHDMYEFNDTRPAGNANRRFRPTSPMSDLRGHSWKRKDGRERLVDIHAWCLMNNHYHLLLSERMVGGITRFMMKVNVGYAKYFNERYRRSGTLFQGRTKKVLVSNDAHYLHILNYIHLNPLDLRKQCRSWREHRIKSAHSALKYLDSYRWSSYLDYCGKSNFPSILTTSEFLGDGRDIREETASYLHDCDMDDISSLTLESSADE